MDAQRRIMKLYLVLTADKYEHIIDFDTNPKKLAERLGITVDNLYCKISVKSSGGRSSYRLCKVEIDDSDE